MIRLTHDRYLYIYYTGLMTLQCIFKHNKSTFVFFFKSFNDFVNKFCRVLNFIECKNSVFFASILFFYLFFPLSLSLFYFFSFFLFSLLFLLLAGLFFLLCLFLAISIGCFVPFVHSFHSIHFIR